MDNWCGCGTSRWVAFARRRRPSRICEAESRAWFVLRKSLSLANIPAAFLLLPFRTVYPPLPRLSQSPRFAFGVRNANSLSSSSRKIWRRSEFLGLRKAKQAGVCKQASGCDRGGPRTRWGGKSDGSANTQYCVVVRSPYAMPLSSLTRHSRRSLHGSCGERKVRKGVGLWCSFLIHGFLRLIRRLESVCRGFSQLRSRWA